jgi:hypothetical protein
MPSKPDVALRKLEKKPKARSLDSGAVDAPALESNTPDSTAGHIFANVDWMEWSNGSSLKRGRSSRRQAY